MKLYITRDEDSDDIWLWLKPKKGKWKPEPLKDCDMVNFQREGSMDEINTYCCYNKKDFKKKFGVGIIRSKTVKCVHLDDTLVLDNKLAVTPLYLK